MKKLSTGSGGITINTLKLIFLLSTFFLVSCSLNGVGNSYLSKVVGNSNSGLPVVQISDTTVNRANTATTCRFLVDLSAAASDTVTVNYSTSDGTATSGKDYTSQSGTLTFQPGKQELSVDIPILPLTSSNQQGTTQDFYIQLSNPSNCTVGVKKTTVTIINAGTNSPADTSGFESPTSYPGYKLVWSDEFNESSLNTNKWTATTGSQGGDQSTYLPANVSVANGKLVMQAKHETYGSYNYTSSRVTTQDKFSFKYGRVDIRAKVPVGMGMWPALWMFSDNRPIINYAQKTGVTVGEIDIAEILGKSPSRLYGTLHWSTSSSTYANLQGRYDLSSGNFGDAYHVFSLIWDATNIQLLCDGNVYITIPHSSKTNYKNGIDPFNANSFYFIFTLGIGDGTNWAGAPDGTDTWPQKMSVDYIRVFQKN